MKPLLLLTLLLASCANKSANPKVRIANMGTGLQTYTMPINLAEKLGYYKDEGLDVTLENLPSQVRTLQALVGGSVDVAGVVYSQTIQMTAEGQRVKSFFVVNRRDSRVLLVAPAAVGRIRGVQDLKGAKIGIGASGSPVHQWTNYFLATHGLQTADFTAVSTGMGAAAFAAVESGLVDAVALAGGDHFHLLRRHPSLRILADTSTPEGMRETYGGDAYAGGTLAAKQEWLDANPDTARRLARALLRALQWITNHTPEQIREQLPDEFRSSDASLDHQIIRWGVAAYTPDGKMLPGAPQAVRRLLDANFENVRNAKIDLNATWTNDFLPNSK